MARHNQEHGGTKRTVIIVTTVLLVITLAVAGFFVWKAVQDAATKKNAGSTSIPSSVNRDNFNNNDYKDWKTYTSEKSGYSIQYPADWIIAPETATESLSIRNKKPVDEGLEKYPQGYINIRIFQTGDEEYSIVDMTAKGWYTILGTTTASNGVVTYNPEDVTKLTLNGHEAKHLKSVKLKTDEDVVLLDNDTLYTINIYPYGALNDETVEKIVASFTFTN